MAGHGAPTYGVVAAGPRYDTCRGQEAFPEYDMYRHVSTYHLDLAQLWRSPVSWCTVFKY